MDGGNADAAAVAAFDDDDGDDVWDAADLKAHRDKRRNQNQSA